MTTPNVDVNFRAVGLQQVQRGLKLVKDEAAPTGRQWGMASRQIASGMEQIARTGKMTGESLKQIVTQGAEMAFMFGAGGPIVAAVGILGVAIYQGITNNLKEARAEARKFQQEVAGVRRSGSLIGAGDIAQRLYSGDRFAVQDEGEKDREFEARRIGVLGLRRRIADLGEYRKEDLVGPRGEVLRAQTGPSYEALQLIKEYSGYLKTYEANHKRAAAAVRELAAAEGSRLANAAALAMERHIKPDVVNHEGRRLDTSMFDRMGLGVGGKVSTPFLDLSSPLRKVTRPEDNPATVGMVENMRAVGELAGRGFVDTLASTIEAGIGKAFEKGANIGGVFAAIGQSALAGIGSIMSQIGRATLASFAFIESIKNAIMTLNPAVGVAASIGLIALGAVLQGAGGRMGSNAGGHGGGGYGGSGGYGSSSGYGASIIDRGMIDPTRGAGVTARSGNVYQFTVIGANDPKAQSDIMRLIDNAERRGKA